MSIVTLTLNPAVDNSTSVAWLVPNIKLKCKTPLFNAGGGGINVARVIKRLNGNALAIFQSSGFNGQIIQQLLDEEEIKFDTFYTEEKTRENFSVMVESTGQQYRFGMPGPKYKKKEVETCFNHVTSITPKPEYLVLSGSLPSGVPVDFFANICGWGKDEEIKIIVDTSGIPLLKAITAGVFLAKPNLKEFLELTGKEIITDQEVKDIALSFVEQNKVEVMIVSMGVKGAIMASKEGVEYCSPPKIKIKSTIGAGDSMTGGMVWALSKGYKFSDVLKYGIACGTAATMNEGTELCKKKDVDKLFKILTK